MQVALGAAIIEVTPVTPLVRSVRDPESAVRQRAKNWVAPCTINRGQLIDLVV